jgi:hypothetical protein
MHPPFLGLLERGVELLLLVEMEPQDGVEAIESPTQIPDVGRFRTTHREVGNLTLEQFDQVKDLAMGPAHHGQRIIPGEDLGHLRVDLGLIFGFVRENHIDEKALDLLKRAETVSRRPRVEGVGHIAQSVELGDESIVFNAKLLRELGGKMRP